jgi:tetratricopeptide (TPR) repeat protein
MIATLFIILTLLPQGAGSALPELPAIVIESYGEEARPRIRAALDLARRQPRDVAAVGQLAMLLHAYEEYEAAEICYRRARELRRDLKWVHLHGIVASQLGRQAEAIASFSEAARLDPGYWAARWRMADSLLALGRAEESQVLLERLVREQTESSLVHYSLGRVLAARREFRRSVEAFQRAVALSPYFGAAHYGLALAARETGEPALATTHLRLYQQYRLIRPFPADRIEQEMLALNQGAAAHLRKGVEYESAGRLEEAITEHEKAVAINPRFEQVRLNLLTLYARAGRIEQAEAEYRAIQALNPNLAESHYNYGVMKAGRTDYTAAREAFERCLALNPYHAQAHYNLGRLSEIEQKYDEARQRYQEAVRLEPANRESRFQLARLQIFKGELPAAIETLEGALQPVDAATPRYLYALAIALARNGERERALSRMRLAREQAINFKQNELLTAIERDLKVLEGR